MKRRNRSPWAAFLSSPVTIAAAAVLLYFLGRAAWSSYDKARDSALELSQASAELSKLESDKTGLQAKIGSLSTDAGVMAAIKERYHAVAPGESVAVIVPSDAGSAQSGEEEASSSEEMAPWWQRLLRAVGL